MTIAPPRALAVALVGGLVLAAASPAASAGEEPPLLRFVRLIESGSARPDANFHAFDTHSANAFDLDGDGRLEVVSQNDNHRVYVFDALDGTLRAELHNNLPEWWGSRDMNGVAIGDVNGNGRTDIVVANSAGMITAFEVAGVETDGRLRLDELWIVNPDAMWVDESYENEKTYGTAYPSADGAAYLADVDGDGRLSVFLQADNQPGHYAFRHDGAFRWGTLTGDGNGGPVVTDLDGDGKLEAIFATDGGRIITYDAKSGKEKWRYHLPQKPGSIPTHPLVADLDGDGKKEIAFGGRGVKDFQTIGQNGEPDINGSHAGFALLGHDGKPRWEISPDFANPLVYMTPIAFDVNGDGVRDVVFLDWNTIGHKPGNWENTGPANLFAVHGETGEVLWRTDVMSVWANKQPALVDVDADGVPEVVAEETRGRNGLSFFDVRNGEHKGFVGFPDGNWVASRGPLAASLDGGDRVHVVVPLVRPASKDHCQGIEHGMGCREGALAVYETRPGARVAFGNNDLFNHELESDDSSGWAVPPPATPPVAPPEPAVNDTSDANETEAPDANETVADTNESAPHSQEDAAVNETRFDAAPDDAAAPPAPAARNVPASGVALAGAALAGAALAGARRRR